MKINFSQFMKQLGKNEPLLKPDSKEPFCLKDAATEALCAMSDDERKMTGEERCKRGLLAMRIYANPENVDLIVEEISLIKQVIGKGYGPLVVAQAWKMLEGEEL